MDVFSFKSNEISSLGSSTSLFVVHFIGTDLEMRSFVFRESYFEKGCRTKCTQHSRKVLWEILSSLFFRKIWKNARATMDLCLRVLKENETKVGSTATVSGTVYWSYPILPSRTVACTFFPTAFLEIAVYTKKKRCQYTLLGHTADNRKRLRKGGVDSDNLLPATEIATKPFCTWRRSSCILKVRDHHFVVDAIEGLTNVQYDQGC